MERLDGEKAKGGAKTRQGACDHRPGEGGWETSEGPFVTSQQARIQSTHVESGATGRSEGRDLCHFQRVQSQSEDFSQKGMNTFIKQTS